MFLRCCNPVFVLIKRKIGKVVNSTPLIPLVKEMLELFQLEGYEYVFITARGILKKEAKEVIDENNAKQGKNVQDENNAKQGNDVLDENNVNQGNKIQD